MKKMKLVPYPKEERLSSKKIGKQRPNTMRPGISISIRVHLRESYGNISEKIKTNQSMLSVWCAQIIPGLATNSSVFVCLCRQKNHYLLGQINDPSSGNILFSVIPFNNSLVLVWKSFSRLQHHLLPKPKRYKDTFRCGTLGARVQLTQTLIVFF